MTPPLIAIIGRPNVGKSTLFNRILGTRSAIVDDVPGVTRDRNYAESTYQGNPFHLVDTGGLDLAAGEGMLTLIRRQVRIAIAEADILILVVDGRAGLTPADEDIVRMLRGTPAPIHIAVNKIDTPSSTPLLADFYRLGQDCLYPISAEHGTGVDDLLEAALPRRDSDAEATVQDSRPRIAIVGRPNVGKSTLINALLGTERMVVSEIPGTTRDSVDSVVSYRDRSYIFTDTAGIRRRGRIERGIEGYSVSRALRAMGRSDIAVLLLDAVEGITEQDTKLTGLILKQGRGCILLVNKWDLREGEAGSRDRYVGDFHRRYAFLTWAPVLFGSALKPHWVSELFPVIDRVMIAFSERVPTAPLNKFLQSVLETHPLPVRKGKPTKPVKSVYATQVATRPPVIALFVGRPQDVNKAYVSFLENRLREHYDFRGTPIRILLRQK